MKMKAIVHWADFLHVMTLRSISNMTTKCSHCIEHGSWINLKSAFSQEKLNFFFSLTTCERESIETTPQNLITKNQNSSLLIQFHYCVAGLALFTSKSVLLNKYRFLDEGKFSAETFKLPVLGLNSIFHKIKQKKKRNSSTSRCAVRVFLLFFARAKKTTRINSRAKRITQFSHRRRSFLAFSG